MKPFNSNKVFTEETFMKNLTISSIVIIGLGGALTCFLWLPLLPVVVPLVTLTIGARWIGSILVSESLNRRQMQASMQSLHYLPITPFSKSQAKQPTAWPSPVSLSSPDKVGAGSLPLLFLKRHDVTRRNLKKEIREYRKLTRVLSGMGLRKKMAGYY
jgi:hypothetical protein